MPIHISPRPVRATGRYLAPLMLAIALRLLAAVALAGTAVWALLYAPQSLLLLMTVVALAAAAVIYSHEQQAAR